MRTLNEVLAEEMKDPEFRKEWMALEPEFRRIREQFREEARERERTQIQSRESPQELYA